MEEEEGACAHIKLTSADSLGPKSLGLRVLESKFVRGLPGQLTQGTPARQPGVLTEGGALSLLLLFFFF